MPIDQFHAFFENHTLLVLGLIGVTVALIGNELTRFTRGYRAINPARLTELINRDSVLVIDVSASGDFEKGHVIGSRNVVMSQFDPENKDLAKVRELPVAVVCKTGATSAQAAARLVKAGFAKVFVLGGGMTAWREAALPTARGNK